MAKHIPEPVFARVLRTAGYPPEIQASNYEEMSSELLEKMEMDVSRSGKRTYFYSEKFDIGLLGPTGAGLFNNCHLAIRWLEMVIVDLENNLSTGGPGFIKAKLVQGQGGLLGAFARDTPLEVWVYDAGNDSGNVSAKSTHSERAWGFKDEKSNIWIVRDFFVALRELCYNPNWEDLYLGKGR